MLETWDIDVDLGFQCSDVYSFDRVSALGQIKGRGLARQGQLAQSWCERHGLELLDERKFADPGKSAFHGKHLRHGSPLARFMDMAERRLLGEYPVLLVEEIDRLTRLAPVDALEEVILKLMRNGVTIVTLMDEKFYNRGKINSDPIALVSLMMYIQGAHDYSRRISNRQSDNWVGVREKLKAGVVARKQHQSPSWVDWNSKTESWELNNKHLAIVRAMQLLKTMGYSQAARTLNEEGFATLSARAKNGWTASNLSSVIRNSHYIYGAAKIKPKGTWLPLERHKETSQVIDQKRERGQVRGGAAEPGEIVRGVFPQILPEGDVKEIVALISGRDRTKSHTGPYSSLHYVGRGLTRCSCGGTMSTCVGGHPPDRLVRYVACRGRGQGTLSSKDCHAPYLPMTHVLAVVLSRLTARELRELSGDVNYDERELVLKKELNALEVEDVRLSNEIEAVNANLGSAATLDPAVFATVAATLGKKIQDLESEQLNNHEAAARVRNQLAQLNTPLEMGLLEDVITPLRKKLLDGSSTLEERIRVNRALKELGLEITINSQAMQLALSINGSEPKWQPIDVELAYELLELKQTGVQYFVRSDAPDVTLAVGEPPAGTAA